MQTAVAFSILRDRALNVLSPPPLAYITEPANWAISTVGQEILQELKTQFNVNGQVRTTSHRLTKSVVHFGSLNTILGNPITAPKSICTIFHILPDDPRSAQLEQLADRVQYIHTASSLTWEALLKAQVPDVKIKVIPLGVNTQIFRPVTTDQKLAIRQRLNLPAKAFVIGSFQKDGQGWGSGDQAKLEKGPDIFVDTVRLVNEHQPVHVLLAGPARGYVKQQLDKYKITYTAVGYLEDYASVAPLYQALDCYLITARVEGGPRQILEAWASGVPVVSTAVGMVADIARHQQTALISQSFEATSLAELVSQLVENTSLANNLRTQASQMVGQYDWSQLVPRYYHELYQPLL